VWHLPAPQESASAGGADGGRGGSGGGGGGCRLRAVVFHFDRVAAHAFLGEVELEVGAELGGGDSRNGWACNGAVRSCAWSTGGRRRRRRRRPAQLSMPHVIQRLAAREQQTHTF
jgi:hypothetical protein